MAIRMLGKVLFRSFFSGIKTFFGECYTSFFFPGIFATLEATLGSNQFHYLRKKKVDKNGSQNRLGSFSLLVGVECVCVGV